MLDTRPRITNVPAILTVSYGLNEVVHPDLIRMEYWAFEIAGRGNKIFPGVSTQGVL